MKAVTNPLVHVTITSDLMCPWCYVGLRKLQKASRASNIDVEITWKPFLLRPNFPMEGQPKGGTPASRVPAHLKAAGKSVGIAFTGLTDRTPNTIDFHAIMKYLLDAEADQTPFQEAVFDAYFTRGIYPDQKAMMDCADKVGALEFVKKLYEDEGTLEQYRRYVIAEAKEASYNGIHGVPSFAFNGGREAFSGAQSINVFSEYLKHHA
jgi:predicted DsbA family dithiol-disulfide isomerase